MIKIENLFTMRQAEKIVAKWQKILRLQDWNIKLVYVTPAEMESVLILGRIRPVISLQWAELQILDPVYHTHDIPFDMEQTIVHELCHLYFAPLELRSSPLEELVEEQAVERLSCGLVGLERKCAFGAN